MRHVNNIEQSVQGPNSKALMFEANLCQKCNNERSQPFDRSYDKFIGHIHYNSTGIITAKQLRFSNIFQTDWLQHRENVIRYYVKHICCRLAEANIFVDQRVISYLNGDNNISCIELEFQIREDIVAMEAILSASQFSEGSVWLGSGMTNHHPSTNTFSKFHSHVGYRWLRVNYVFDDMLIGEFNKNPTDLLVFESGNSIAPSTILKLDKIKSENQ